MGRLKELRKYINKELDQIEDSDTRISAIAHLYGVSLAATMLAKRRELDEELAAMAAMLHDMYAYKSGSYDDHAHKGAELAREILNELKLTNGEETDIICSAIYHHDDKLTVDAPMDELLKDADVIHHTMNDPSKPIKEKEQKRYDDIIDELGLKPLPFPGFNPFRVVDDVDDNDDEFDDEDFPEERLFYRVDAIDKLTEESVGGYLEVGKDILSKIKNKKPGYITKKQTDLSMIFEALSEIQVPDEYLEDKENRYCIFNEDSFDCYYTLLQQLDEIIQKNTDLKLGYIDITLNRSDDTYYEDDDQAVISKETYLKYKEKSFYLPFEKD